MFKVLIVDDEIYVVALIRKLIDWDKFDMKVEGTANDGITALNMVKEINPDLVIVDIRMPGYDGISFMDKVREFNTNVRFIVISGHKQFDYAKGAMRNNVEDYLLKPINKEELESVLGNVYKQLREIHEKEQQIQMMETELDSSKQRIREALIDNLMAGAREELELSRQEINSKYKTDFREGRVCILCLITDMPVALQEGALDDLMLQEIRADLLKNLQDICYEVVEAVRDNRAIYLVNYKKEKGEEIRRLLNKRILIYSEQIRKFDNLFIRICVGNPCESGEEVEKSVEAMWKCILARTAFPNSRLFFSGDIKESDSLLQAIWEPEKEKFADALELLDVEVAILEIKKMYTRAFYGVEEDTLLYYKLYMKIVQEIHQYFNNIEICRETWEQYREKMKKHYILAPQSGDYSRILGREIENMTEQLNQLSDKEQSAPAIRIVKRYIRENYKDDISLSSAADKANISSVYLSRLFKKEEGINFLDYLNQCRIEEAKKLLKDVQYNILDVADETGFKNTRYFSKIFKKNVGITPSEYRKRHLGKDE